MDSVLESKEEDIASTYVNICTIYSEMGKYFSFLIPYRHDIALSYIEKSVQHLEQAHDYRYP